MNSRTVVSMVLAYLVPGAGHFYLGHRARAIAFAAIVALLFMIGLSIDGDLYSFRESGGSLLRILATLGTMGSGLLYFVGHVLGVQGDITSATYEYGTTFALTAGLMNHLLVLDCFDLSTGRKE